MPLQSEEVTFRQKEEIEEIPEKETPTVDPALKSQLDQIQSNTRDTTAIARILADPDIQRIIAIRNAGGKVKIDIDNGETKAVVEDPLKDFPENLEDLTPKDLAERINRSVLGGVKELVGQAIKESLGPVQQQLHALTQEAVQGRTARVRSAASELRDKYQDFDKFIPRMSELHQETNGSLSLERLYLLAKAEAGSPLTPDHRLDSEVPDSPSRGRVQHPKVEQNHPIRGRAGLKALLADATDRMILPKGMF